MPGKKDNGKNRSRPERPGARPPAGGSYNIFGSKILWQLVAVFVLLVLMYLFWSKVSVFFDTMRQLFGYGVIVIAFAFFGLLTIAWRRKLGTFIHYWNRWLGAISFTFAAWGILGIIEYHSTLFKNGLGGSFGRALVANPSDSMTTFLGALCILGFVVLGLVLAAPRPIFNALRKFFGALFSRREKPPQRVRVIQDEKQPARRFYQPVKPDEKPAPPAVMRTPLEPPEATKSRKKLEDLAEKAVSLKQAIKPAPLDGVPLQKDLKQVASDVWKKYGQSSKLVIVDGWSLPPIDILDTSPEVQFSDADNEQRARLIEDTLSSYGVDAKVVQINAGPTVTQFGVEPGWDIKYKEIKEKDGEGNTQLRREEISRTRVKVERISSLSNDLSLALAAPTIRIEAPVPGKSFVGVEVPNMTSDMVSLRGVVETSTFQKLVSKTKMALALGKGAGGESIAADLTKMPHLLIAGATGSGKTVCLNTIIVCLLLHNTPNDVRFILIDPKRVELTQYNSIPHLATPVIVDTNKALNSLRWLCQEMDDRYKKMAAAGARHIEGYNKDKKGSDKLPYLVLIIDELADLMMAGYDEVETNLCRLAQLARATGIHLVVATQRPSVDVVTGLIKANFPTRISFAVTSQVDSRTILDGAGAEKLLGRGDMLFMPTEAAKPKRLQGCFLSDPEIERLVYFWGSQQKEEPDKLRMETLIATAPTGTIGGHPRDSLLEQAKELAKEYEDVSTSFLQRKLHIGYPRAARLKEQLDAVMSQEGAPPPQEGGELKEEGEKSGDSES
jgi:S-DNA-T family DNA segregation ATPase FtsK/SpoIIIE